MDSYGITRLAAKDPQAVMLPDSCEEEGEMTRVLAINEHRSDAPTDFNGKDVPLLPGELCYVAVAATEPPGRTIAACSKVRIRLQLVSSKDRHILDEQGLARMRQARLVRLAQQARAQGALLTVEDLAFLTCSSPATVKRDLAFQRRRGDAAPTRGHVRGIGLCVTTREGEPDEVGGADEASDR